MRLRRVLRHPYLEYAVVGFLTLLFFAPMEYYFWALFLAALILPSARKGLKQRRMGINESFALGGTAPLLTKKMGLAYLLIVPALAMDGFGLFITESICYTKSLCSGLDYRYSYLFFVFYSNILLIYSLIRSNATYFRTRFSDVFRVVVAVFVFLMMPIVLINIDGEYFQGSMFYRTIFIMTTTVSFLAVSVIVASIFSFGRR